MPFLFLSPSTQQFNPYITTGNEEYWMNEIADRMEPYLLASGINVTRNDPNGTAATAIRQSNMGNYDFHLALHSNAGAGEFAGKLRGIDAYYYPGSAEGQRMADLLVENLKPIYPLPDRVQARTTTSIGEVRRTNAPSVLVELGYHDNLEDANWIMDNVDEIALALSKAVAQYFNLPFLQPEGSRTAVITTQDTGLNLRGGPGLEYPVLTRIPRGAQVSVLERDGDWYVVDYNGTVGYANSNFVSLI